MHVRVTHSCELSQDTRRSIQQVIRDILFKKGLPNPGEITFPTNNLEFSHHDVSVDITDLSCKDTSFTKAIELEHEMKNRVQELLGDPNATIECCISLDTDDIHHH